MTPAPGRPVGAGMRTYGLGMDLVEIGRLERALARYPRLADRIFTDAELTEAGRLRRPGRHLAGRFAVKEAVVKALALPPGAALRSIEVLGSAPPEVVLHGDAAEAAQAIGATVRVSITHERKLAGAVALAEV